MKGITVAAQSALTLAEILAKTVRENQKVEIHIVSYMFIKELHHLLRNSWNMATASDYRFPTTITSSNAPNLKRHAFEKVLTDCLLCQAQQDPKLYLKLLEIAHLTKPAHSLSTDLYVVKSLFTYLVHHIWRQMILSNIQ